MTTVNPNPILLGSFGSTASPQAATKLRRIEPMLLLHEERVRTIQLALEQFSWVLQSLKRRAAGT